MLLDWRGWEHADRGDLELVTDWHPLYFHLHAADRWDQMPLLRIESPELRFVLGLSKQANYISPHQLATTIVEERRTERRLPFPTWSQKLVTMEQAGEELTELEHSAVELARRLWLYQDHRMGRGLEVLSLESREGPRWLSVAQLLVTRFDVESDPTGELRKCQGQFLQVRKSFQEHDSAAFARASDDFLTSVRCLGKNRGGDSSPWAIGLELAYNRWAPFRWGWAFMLAAAVGLWLHSAWPWRPLSFGAMAAYLAGVLVVAIGIGLRFAIAGRPPVTNMYESVIYVGAGVAVLGLVVQLIHGKTQILAAAATLTTILLAVAKNCPLILDPAVRPLEPVLRSNFWLAMHVMTITLSYAAFALALGIGNVTLGHYLLGSTNRPAVRSLSRLTYQAMQVGVLLLSAGIILGGVWADYSWGRFWGWDPKEVWALVALLGYLAVLCARFAGWVGHWGLAALSVACFSLVIMAWYGVNFVLGAGLHTYGLCSGGQGYVLSAVGLQLVFVGVVFLRTSRSAANETLICTVSPTSRTQLCSTARSFAHLRARTSCRFRTVGWCLAATGKYSFAAESTLVGGNSVGNHC